MRANPRTPMKSKSLNQMDLIYLAESMTKEQASFDQIQQAVATFLSEHEMTANDLTSNGKPLMVEAMEYSRNAPLVKALLECGGDLHWCDRNGNTLMHYAVHFASHEKHTSHDPSHTGFTPCVMEILLEKGLTFDERSSNGDTPLFAMWWPVLGTTGHPSAFLDAILRFAVIPQTKKMLQWLSENSNNMFAKNNAGHSFLACTHVDQYAPMHPEYLQLEAIVRPYKDQEQAHTLAQVLGNQAHTRTARKM